MRRNTSGRGFASMDRDEQRRIASMGGRASHGGRGGDYDYDYDDRRRGSSYDEDDYDEDDDYGTRGSYNDDYDEDEDYDVRGDYDEDDDYDRGRGREDYGERRGGGRGFASMDRDEVRRIAAKGGRASHGGGRGGYDYDDDRRRGSSYDGDRRRSSSRDYDDDRRGRRNTGDGRGFASMDRDEVRRLASMGGRAAHQSGHAHEWDSREAREAGRRGGQASRGGYDYDDERGRRSYDYDDDRGRRGGNNGRSSRRGFAAMSPEQRSRIAAKGGHASHGGGRSSGRY